MWNFGTFEYFYKGIVSSIPRLISAPRPARPIGAQLSIIYTKHTHNALQWQLWVQPQHSFEYQPQFKSQLQLPHAFFLLNRFVQAFWFFFFPFFAYLFGEVSWHLYKPCHGLRFKYFHMPCFFQIFHCVYKKKMFMKFTFIKMQRCNRAVKQPAARKRWLNSTKTSSRDEHVSAWSKYLPWWCEAAILDITTVPSCRQYDSKTGVMIGVRTQLFLHKVVLKLH